MVSQQQQSPTELTLYDRQLHRTALVSLGEQIFDDFMFQGNEPQTRNQIVQRFCERKETHTYTIVVCDDSNNTEADLDAGRLNVNFIGSNRGFADARLTFTRQHVSIIEARPLS